MRIDVLGPLVVRDNGVLLPLHTSMASALCWLVANANEPVSYASLIDVLGLDGTGDDPARRAKAVVRRLHAHLGDPITLTPTYASLRLGGERNVEVDAVLFNHLLEGATVRQDSGDDAEALASLVAALGLWRGDPYPELAGSLAALPVIAGLVERYQTAREDLAGLRLRGRVDFTLVADLRAEVTRCPDRPRLQREFAIALYRTGRQVEALDVLVRARSAGDAIEAAQAEALHNAILCHDPALERGELQPS